MTTVHLTQDGDSLQVFLSVTEPELSQGLTGEVLHDAARGETAEFGRWVSDAKWPSMPTALAQRVAGFLQGDSAEIFAGAWAKCSELKTCADESRTNPNDTTSVQLTSHDFTYELKPSVDVLVDGVKIGAFPFVVTLACEVNGVELQIKNGAIVAVRTGSADGTAKIACATNTIWHRDLGRVNLPGKLRLRKPIPI